MGLTLGGSPALAMAAGDGVDAGSALAAAAAAAIAGAGVKAAATAAASAAEAAVATAKAQEIVGAALAPKASAGGESVRFFVRGLGNLGEHHLRDHFEQFGEVLEAALMRDKKTQRPRGMAFVTLRPKAVGEEQAPSVGDLLERLMRESHTIKDLQVELQEALPKPEKEGEKPAGAPVAPAAAAPDGASGLAKAAPAEATVPALEPEAQEAAQVLAQAQWQMHYLAMAINASVPEAAAFPPVLPGAAPKAAAFNSAKRPARGGPGRSGPY